MLNEFHKSRSEGHFGILDSYCWVNCRTDVEEWIKRCDLGASKKGPKTRSKGKLTHYVSGSSWERIAADILGPFLITATGNIYLMVSKWPEVVPIPNQEASTVIEALLPQELHSNHGRNFESEVCKEVMNLGIKKTRTTSLHSQSDGKVERLNRRISNYLSLFVSDNQRDWDKLVPLFLLSYRTAQHEATGYTNYINSTNWQRDET